MNSELPDCCAVSVDDQSGVPFHSPACRTRPEGSIPWATGLRLFLRACQRLAWLHCQVTVTWLPCLVDSCCIAPYHGQQYAQGVIQRCDTGRHGTPCTMFLSGSSARKGVRVQISPSAPPFFAAPIVSGPHVRCYTRSLSDARDVSPTEMSAMSDDVRLQFAEVSVRC